MSKTKHRILYPLLIAGVLAACGYFFSKPLLTAIGSLLIANEGPAPCEAVVVLNTGMAFYPRLIEAASLYRMGFAPRVVINGNRKSDVLRQLEKKGFRPCCPWYEESLRILALLGVPRKDVISISIEDAYDTLTEAQEVGRRLIDAGIDKILITTSKSHTRRARHIWKTTYPKQLTVRMVAAGSDPFLPECWWKEGRQIKWVLSEYGAWLYYLWEKKIRGRFNRTAAENGKSAP